MATSDRAARSPLGDLLGVVLAAVAMAAGGLKALRRRGRRAPIDLRVPPAASAGAPVFDDPDDARRARERAGVHEHAAERDDDRGSRKPPGGIKARLRVYGDRWPALGTALDVQERYSALHGNNLAGSVTLQAFLSLFPLILLAVAVVGFFARNADVAGSIIRDLGLSGDAARAVRDAVRVSEHSRKAASLIGLAGLLWSGLGLVDALQYAYNQAWQVKQRGIKDKAVGVAWLAGAGVLFVLASASTAALRWLPGVFAPLAFVIALTVDVAVWAWTAKLLPNRDVPWRAVMPGAILGGVGLEALKALGAFYVPRLVASSSQLYGSLGVVFAIIAWLFFFGRLIVYSATLNVVLWERKTGTVPVVTEVPNVDGADPGDTATRLGRLERTPA